MLIVQGMKKNTEELVLIYYITEEKIHTGRMKTSKKPVQIKL